MYSLLYIQYILKFESIPAVIRIDYNNTTTSRSKLKYDSKESVLELYVLTKQGKLWQIYLIIEKEEEEKQMQLKTLLLNIMIYIYYIVYYFNDINDNIYIILY